MDPGSSGSLLIFTQHNKTVCDIKKAMMQDYDLRGLSAKKLTLYKVSIPDDEYLEQTLGTLSFDGTDNRVERLRFPAKLLSEVFPTGVQQRHLHIIVQKPGTC